jgi:hypothetical protein
MMAMAWMLTAAETPHPRPDFERKAWQPLNGIWEFQFDPDDKGLMEGWQQRHHPFETTIRVPFGWESPLSGVHRPDYKGVAWYRREFTLPTEWQNRRIWLCFGAVDWQAQVWVNGKLAGMHEGGYSEFRLDITALVRFDAPNRLVVRVEDRTDPETPLGKQIPNWYTSTSGIWQTVWLEATGDACIKRWRILPEGDAHGVPTGQVQLHIEIERGAMDAPLTVQVRSPQRRFAAASAILSSGETRAVVTLRVRRPRFWTPETPVLYPFTVRLLDAKRSVLDEVHGYFGIRTVRWGRFAAAPNDDTAFSYVLLNGKPLFLRGVLDQSFNPEGIYTAPSDEFLKRDIMLAKRAGFNMLRIHIKADEPRKLYWADRLGILVQADIPCTYLLTERARQHFERTLRDQIERDFNHPSLIIWTIFNEEWGIGSLPGTERSHRVDWVLQMVQLARQLDPTRLIHDNSGWSHLETDLNSFHWYGRDVDAFRTHYQQINAREVGLGKSWNYIDGRVSRGEPFINNEFSYLAAGDGDGDWSWGNLMVVNALRSLDKLVGYTYTELTDIEWEHNGVYNYDRSPKEFGYDFWADGMTVADLFAEDFLVSSGFVEYAVRLPEELPIERLEQITLVMEVSAKAGREKVDWAQRVHPDDYPQTDGKKFPSRVRVALCDTEVAVWELPDDPADARGVLSHWAGVERGSYGYRREATLKITPTVRAQLLQHRTVRIRLTVPPEQPGGIALYGARMGCYPMEPYLLLKIGSDRRF